jgi:hypothetical protein
MKKRRIGESGSRGIGDKATGGQGEPGKRRGGKPGKRTTGAGIRSPIPQAGEANRAWTVSSQARSAVGGRSHTSGGRHHPRCSAGGAGPVHAGRPHTPGPAAAAPPGVGPGGPAHPRWPRNVVSEIAKDLAGLAPRLQGLALSLSAVVSATRFRLPYALPPGRVVFRQSGPWIFSYSRDGIRGLPCGRSTYNLVLPLPLPQGQ